MFLQRLKEYSDRLDLPPEMYLKTRVHWLIDLDEKGRLKGFTSLSSGPGQKGRGKDLYVPHVGRTVGIKPKLLADTGEYVLGVPRDSSKSTRVKEAHREFVDLVGKCAQDTGEPLVGAVFEFLKHWSVDISLLPEDFDPTDILTFRIGDKLLVELPAVKDFWRTFTQSGQGRIMQCLVCGQEKPVVDRQPVSIKRVPGGQPSGVAVISANSSAFESYGLKASLTGATCRDCGERFGKALNDLIGGEQTHLTIGNMLYVFWTREETPFSAVSFLDRPDPEEVKKLIESVIEGQELLEVEENAFYAAALSGSGGRLVVRDWLETTVGDVKRNLVRWFRMQSLVDPQGERMDPLGIYPLAASLYRDPRKEMPANLPRTLLRVALNGGRLPEWILYQAIKRNRAQQGVTRERMALIKMVLVSQNHRSAKEETMAELELDNKHPAYLCGRLLAELEAVQRVAIPGIKATLVDRYFGTASSAPATVFGTLLRNVQSHLAKLRKEREGAYYGFQNRIEEIMENLSSFPATLSLKEQALFSLGYYHQRAYDRAEAKKHSEKEN